MGFSEQCSKNNIIFRHIGIQSRGRNKNTLITMVGPTIIFTTNGSSMPYSQSVCAHGKAVVLDIAVSEP